MNFIDIQTTLTVVVLLTAAAALVFVDHRRKRPAEAQQIRIQNSGRRAAKIFEPTPIDIAPVKKIAAERPLEPVAEPMVAVATPSRPVVEHRIERETVTVEMAPGVSAPADMQLEDVQLESASLPAFTIDAELWDRLIGAMPQQDLLEAGARVEAKPKPVIAPVIEDEPEPSSGSVLQRPALDHLLETNALFTGLLVSVGVNEAESGMWHAHGLMQSVGTHIASLLKPSEYSCRTAYDEFVMICPGEQGAEAQRRLNHISERLWDYQLRGMHTNAILFSWGGVQAYEQPLADAFASAIDRMRETKRFSQTVKTQVARNGV